MEPNNQQEPVSSQPVQNESQASGAGDHKLMGILSYIGPLVIVPYLSAKNDPFVKFHVKQGLVLLVIEVAVMFVMQVAWMFWPILQIVNFATVILSIIGIVNVVHHKEKELPVVGKFAKHVTI